MRYSLAITAAMAATMFLIGGCSSGPNDADLRAAMKKTFQGMAGSAAASMFTDEQYKKVKIIGCVKADSQGYRCDVQGLLGPMNVRMVKGDDGWVMMLN